MSIQTQINRINGNIASAYNAVGNKGGEVPTTKNSDNLEAAIDSIPTGIQLDPIPDTEQAGVNDIAYGKKLYDDNGEIVTGTVPVVDADVYLDAPKPIWETEKGGLRVGFHAEEGRTLLEPNVNIWSDIPGAALGTATEDDVVVDTTFTSKDGLAIPGKNPYKRAETDATVNEQTTLLNQALVTIANKTAGSGSGEGVQLPELNNPDGNPAEHLAQGWELIDDDGNIVTGELAVLSGTIQDTVGSGEAVAAWDESSNELVVSSYFDNKYIVEVNTTLALRVPKVELDALLPDSGGSGTVNLQEAVVVFPKAEFQEIIPETGYDGFSKVYVAPEPDLKAENIKKGVVLYDDSPEHRIVGTYEGSGGGSNAYSKSEEFTWTVPSDIVAGSATVSIPHTLGEEPDGFVLTAVTPQWDNAKYVAMNMAFDRSLYFSNFGSYVATIPGMNEGNYFGNACMVSSKYSDFCTSTHIKIGNMADMVGNIIFPAGKQYRVLVYKR